MNEKSTILVVEDELMIAMDLQRVLSDLGHHVPVMVSSGTAAIKKARQLKPDLILMDIVLQGEMDGIKAAEAIREELGTPIVFVTSYADGPTLERVKAIDPVGYVIKPFDLESLRVTVELALHKGQIDRKLHESRGQAQTLLVERKKMEALSVMAAGVAHEVNTPLAIISYITEDIRDELKSKSLVNAKINSCLGKIDETVKRIAGITKGMLAFARGDAPVRFSKKNVREIIIEAYDLCIDRFMENDVTLEVVNSKDNSLTLDCQPIELVQVVVILLNNARDAIMELPERWVRMGSNDLGDRVQISVTDSGKGIHPEIISKILDPFFTTKGAGKGTGLGLSIAKTIIDYHHGTLEVDRSCPNTRFLVTFPKVQAPKSPPRVVGSK